MLTFLRTHLRRFSRNTEGSMSLEVLIFAPLLFGTITATFAMHDAFRFKDLNSKATYAISDALARETDAITPDYLDGMVKALAFLTKSESAYSLRVSVVQQDPVQEKLVIDWSRTRGVFEEMTQADLDDMAEKIPTLVDNERLILVETHTEYAAPFDLSKYVTGETFYNFVFARPRFAPQLLWEEPSV
ncbi:hypothetical protein KUV62_21705 [Salipiger bermudensis]|uniref:TadE/TadG family type IV pilus assembly protein n=1 Tax=Salipiger bermudensis TaxID=344736 RepID=UPI001C9909A0|nr:hypothetical protein [Salipiger bermudensis]MBY6006554.1 hypothetical protein [Salipiger bermudensis]